MRKIVFIAGLLLACLLACQRAAPPAEQPSGEAISQRRNLLGTFVDIAVWGETPAMAQQAIAAAFAAIEDLNSWANPEREGSELFVLNQNAGGDPVPVNRELLAILEMAHEVSVRSEGAFDVTFAGIGRLWNLKDAARFTVPDEATLRSAVALIDYHWLELDHERSTARLRKPGSRVNLGGIAKGWAADLAMRELKRAGVTNALINAGGDVLVSGAKDGRPWRVGIQHPRKKHSEYFGVVELRGDISVATSGDYERFVMHDGVRYHHIFDPKTGKPARASQSVTMIAANAALADALATAVFVAGPKKGLALLAEHYPQCAALVIDRDGKMHQTLNFGQYLQDEVSL